MVNNRFVLYQVKREIKRVGIPFVFWRRPINEFGEFDNEAPAKYLCTIKGMYHEFTAHMTDTVVFLTGMEYGLKRNKKTPQCLCEYDSVNFTNKDGEVDSVKAGDMVFFNNRVMKVTGLQNIMEWNKVVDISFEEVDDGSDSYIRRQEEPNQSQIIQLAERV